MTRNMPPVRRICVTTAEDTDAAVRTVASILRKRIEERCPTTVTSDAEGDVTIEFQVREGIGTEGFILEDDPGGNDPDSR